MAQQLGELGDVGDRNGNKENTDARVRGVEFNFQRGVMTSRSIVMSRGVLRRFPFHRLMMAYGALVWGR